MTSESNCRRRRTLDDGISSLLIAVTCVVRGLPLFVSAKPGTPLRVLCIMAFDTLHTLRHAKRLPATKVETLAALLDLGASANAAHDVKDYNRHGLRMTLESLAEAGIRSFVVEYLRRLDDLESGRPLPGGDRRQFQQVRAYREAVVRLSLGVAAATANGQRRLDEEIRATCSDADLRLLFQIVMQCQIIDDVLDYSNDLSAGLPSFLTACKPLPQAFELTRLAALGYADVRNVPRTGDVVPLRLALLLATTCAMLAVFLGRLWHRMRFEFQNTERDFGSTARAFSDIGRRNAC